jgi:predicted O-methyltransferase YrrM
MAAAVIRPQKQEEERAVNEQLRELLRELEEKGREHDAVQTEQPRKMLNLDPRTAQLLTILARASGATRILEIGTSNGYSTIWLAWAASLTGGRVTSIEHNPDKRALAEANLRRSGLTEYVELRLGDASEVVRNLSGPFDLVFLDADRKKFPEQLTALLPKLAPRVLVAADNAISHAEMIAEYLKMISGLAEFQHMVVPVGKGLSLAYRG